MLKTSRASLAYQRSIKILGPFAPFPLHTHGSPPPLRRSLITFLHQSLILSPRFAQAPSRLSRTCRIPSLPRGSKIMLCKGDVKAMYTNIPRHKLLRTLKKAMQEFMPHISTDLKNLLIDGVALVNENSFFTYNSEQYWVGHGFAHCPHACQYIHGMVRV
jgi:hypothetical protein